MTLDSHFLAVLVLVVSRVCSRCRKTNPPAEVHLTHLGEDGCFLPPTPTQEEALEIKVLVRHGLAPLKELLVDGTTVDEQRASLWRRAITHSRSFGKGFFINLGSGLLTAQNSELTSAVIFDSEQTIDKLMDDRLKDRESWIAVHSKLNLADE